MKSSRRATSKLERPNPEHIAEAVFKSWVLRELRRDDAMDRLLGRLGAEKSSDEQMEKIRAELYGE